MPQVLTTNATIMCPHGGVGSTVPAIPKWQINGGYVAVEGDTGALSCPFGLFPCTGYQLRSMGLNASKIDGRKVVLVTDFNQSFTGLPLLMTEFHQTFDESTPAPIPAGRPAPAPSDEMADLSQPIVTPPLQALPFSITTTPAPVVATFNLQSAHPLQWIVTVINTTLKYNQDLTHGAPGVTVVPANGQWSTPNLTVTATLTPAFMAALTPGTHHLFLTAISRRGLSQYAEAILGVSP